MTKRNLDGQLPTDRGDFSWDGETQYSRRPAMLFPYVKHCLMCGRDTPVEWISNERAGDLGRAGLPNCPDCGGWRHMDPVEVGGISSSMSAAPRRTVAEPTRPVPRKAAVA